MYIAIITQYSALIPRFYGLFNRSMNEMHLIPIFYGKTVPIFTNVWQSFSILRNTLYLQETLTAFIWCWILLQSTITAQTQKRSLRKFQNSITLRMRSGISTAVKQKTATSKDLSGSWKKNHSICEMPDNRQEDLQGFRHFKSSAVSWYCWLCPFR